MELKKMLTGFQMALKKLLKGIQMLSMMDSDEAGPAKRAERRVEGGKTTTRQNVQARER